MVLDYTSNLKLLKSIKKDYAKNTKAQQEAIYEQQKQYVGKSADEVLDEKWKHYTEEHGPQQGKVVGGKNQ